MSAEVNGAELTQGPQKCRRVGAERKRDRAARRLRHVFGLALKTWLQGADGFSADRADKEQGSRWIFSRGFLLGRPILDQNADGEADRQTGAGPEKPKAELTVALESVSQGDDRAGGQAQQG